MDMIVIAGAQFLFKLACALAAIICMSRVLIYLNNHTGNRFDETLANASDNVRLGYFGARIVAYAYIVGTVLS